MATLKDVANLAGVSSASVSRILNNDLTLSVPQSTREKVIEAAQSLGYVKKKKKVESSSMLIGIVQWISPIEEMEDSYYLSIRQGVENFCVQHKISIIRIFSTDIDLEKRLEKVDGLVCIGKFSDKSRAKLTKICSNLIFLDMNLSPITGCCILPDFKNALKAVIDCFAKEGHKTVGYLGGQEYIDGELYPDERLRYFVRYANRAAFEYENYIELGEFSSESGYTMMKDMIEKHNVPTAIFAASDAIALGALRALHEAGYSVPQDVSLIGFNNIEAANYSYPPLTTVFAPTYDIGSIGMRMLYDACRRNENLAPMRVQLPCYVVVRETTRSNPEEYETATALSEQTI